MAKFPEIKGKNLEGKDLKIPGDLGEAAVILAFKRSQQADVESWKKHLGKQGLPVYEVAVINSFYRPMRRFIDWGMHEGIPDKETREKTITVYTRKNRLLELLDITEDQAHIYLLGSGGEIRQHIEGPYGKEKQQDPGENLTLKA